MLNLFSAAIATNFLRVIIRQRRDTNLTFALHRNYSITDHLGFPGIIPVLPRQYLLYYAWYMISSTIRSGSSSPRVPLCSGVYDAVDLVYVREFFGYLLGWPLELSRRTNPEVKLDSGQPFVQRDHCWCINVLAWFISWSDTLRYFVPIIRQNASEAFLSCGGIKLRFLFDVRETRN